jgi:hypothetical protein
VRGHKKGSEQFGSLPITYCFLLSAYFFALPSGFGEL